MSFNEQRVARSPTGAELNLYVKHADERPRAVVQINHGLAEHSARYARFADFLADRGFHVYAHDHRGHGATKAPDAPLGRFANIDGIAKVIADVDAVHDLIAAEHPGLPVIVFGHSLGASIALNFVLRHSGRVHAAAIWNGNFAQGLLGQLALGILGWERMRLGSDVPSRLLPRLTFQAWGKAVPNHRTLFDWLSRDPAEVDKYIADPLCGWDASISMWRDVVQMALHAGKDASFAGVRQDLPVNLVGGEKDPASDYGKAVSHLARRMDRMGFSNLVSKVYADTRHESLNEVNRDIVMNDFAAWANSVLKS
ncbi:alpha/beta hydrolase [Mesorhizobium sp. M1C.F.Ca.ET.193.01.1.1]|uniref:alpha/beta fold hydrolase n=1 Tax=unclassified Mesorhizobium TaxID=325217 RepID=UPI000FD1F220|nr:MULTISPECIES: alpha/beta hydrolase [unclassified Mesorhizobium]TGT02782.1 alpha/beta hydrolase [bacterium M00.F.Ca.ET.177.01.1.1]TGQ55643.1 alpha/beta hydrolase [Mesorhizobium sp. M1C.F.Ca.ET.210.01.1.1]TGQ74098.1 alpha/beta hydrolase [Mesorhizobium sp. M1C.F.Ca.ET.212.01.1.1]TGR12727.1 alpha/beta hydrolase [Mesorhizobium sp. M1C.F.Ca.ET.204.01.1.1]TGR32686.1 alpha/beta hydrolase [Mesorhizobium sp. M1C.F.Ca.ET.196.01.1.1]